MGRSRRRPLRQRRRATHRALHYAGHRSKNVEAFATIATFARAGHDFLIALPAETVLGGKWVTEEMPISLIMTDRQGLPVEVAKFWLEREHDQVVLEWTTAVQDIDWDFEADRNVLQEVTTAFCIAMFAGQPLDPALGIHFSSGLATTTRDQHGNLFGLNIGVGDDEQH